jgi:hypothetical protein
MSNMERWAARVKRFLINPEERTPHWSAVLFAIGCLGMVGAWFYNTAPAGPQRPTDLVPPGILLVLAVIALVPTTRYLAVAAVRVMGIMIVLAFAIFAVWLLLT